LDWISGSSSHCLQETWAATRVYYGKKK